ncbi:hypothetical protein L6164_028444 [Bauhinia variegata]|uniref:Uncharacterized protein n=1 Tax=Bauhinia variegata TaxID=167791 RepID=A0ACB9L6Q6_BAUVA|nr:hypothetical protein L6164_028444 [Bauhinia variegata]
MLRFLPGECLVEAIANDLCNRDEILKQLKYNLLKAQQVMSNYANKHRRELQFKVGDLRLRPQRQSSMAKRINPKLSPKYFGPFQVIEQIGKVAYKLNLPNQSRIHPVFHVSQLKAAVGNIPAAPEISAGLATDLPTVEPEEVIKHRTINRNNALVPQVLVKWKGLLISEATWGDEGIIQGQFPDVSLEDKAVHPPGGLRPVRLQNLYFSSVHFAVSCHTRLA